MKKRKTWRSKLTKKEVAHLREMEMTTLTQVRLNMEGQKKMRKEHPDFREPCWECRGIAVKLGLEV